ncbi:FCD domain-containing protein [Metapseudomonas otitidis]|uniref:FCD domain-containing protein n=1 Tax=Metapseudomonas otitidis TaxID=319939 RepID=UPI003EE408A3
MDRLQQEGYLQVHFRSGWEVLPFEFERFEALYDLRIVLERAAIERLCEAADAAASLAPLYARWQVPPSWRSEVDAEVAAWDEAFHCELVAVAGNPELARVHREVSERIRVVRAWISGCKGGSPLPTRSTPPCSRRSCGGMWTTPAHA